MSLNQTTVQESSGASVDQLSAQVVIAFSLAIALLIFLIVQLLYRSTTRHTRLITSLRRIRFVGYLWWLSSAEGEHSADHHHHPNSNPQGDANPTTASPSPGLFAGKHAYLHSVIKKGCDDVDVISKAMKVAVEENRLKHRWLPTTLRSFDVSSTQNGGGADRMLISRRDAVTDCRTMLERLRVALGPSFGQSSHVTMRLGLQSLSGVLDPVSVARFLRIYESVTSGPARMAFEQSPESGVTGEDLMFLQQYFYNTVLKEI